MKLYVIKNKSGRYYGPKGWVTRQCGAYLFTKFELNRCRRDIVDIMAGERIVRLRRRTAKQERADVLAYFEPYNGHLIQHIRDDIAAGNHVRKK